MMVGDFLKAVAPRRRVAGEWDCCTFPAEWIMSLGFADPMAHWRGRYQTEFQAERFVKKAGGLAVLFAEGLDALAPRRAAADLQAGDVGVVSLLGADAGGIYTGRRWAFVAERGIVAASFEVEQVVSAWGFGRG